MYTEEEVRDLLRSILKSENLKAARSAAQRFINSNHIDLFADFESDSDSEESIENDDDWLADLGSL